MKQNIRAWIIFLACGASACTHSSEETIATSKQEARKENGAGRPQIDLCDFNHWYGDGECDDFCVEHDSDCDACAQVLPTCLEDEQQYQTQDQCEENGLDCRKLMTCGGTVWCGKGRNTCAAFPACGEDESTYSDAVACKANHESCYKNSACGSTVWCGVDRIVTCSGIPTCGNFRPQYFSEVQCRAEHDTCYRESVCGNIIWCGNEGACHGPNPQGCAVSGCPEGFVCNESRGSTRSACVCDQEQGWICINDIRGGVCEPDRAGTGF